MRVRQVGHMWMKPGGRALVFEATEEFAVERVEFAWHAHFPLVGRLGLRVVDGFAEGGGRLRVSTLGIPIQTQAGPEIDSGEAMRYLAELSWAPQAILGNPNLQWREIDASSVEVGCAVGSGTATVRWHFDGDGDLRRVTGLRLFPIEGKFTPTPWGGDFDHYEDFAGTRIPSRAEVWWDLPEGRFVYWRGQITALSLLGEQS